jgi:hypothetical protein
MGQTILAWLHEHGGRGRLRQIDAGVNPDRPGTAGETEFDPRRAAADECMRSIRTREMAGINAAIRIAQQAIPAAKRCMAASILMK